VNIAILDHYQPLLTQIKTCGWNLLKLPYWSEL